MAHATARNPRALWLPWVGASRSSPTPLTAPHTVCGQPTRDGCFSERAGCVTHHAVLPYGSDDMTQWRDQRIGHGAQHGLGYESVRRGNAVPAHDVRREPCPTKSNNRNTPAPKAGDRSWASVAARIYEENKASSVRDGPKVVPHWNSEVRCLVTQVYLSPVQQSSGTEPVFHYFMKTRAAG